MSVRKHISWLSMTVPRKVTPFPAWYALCGGCYWWRLHSTISQTWIRNRGVCWWWNQPSSPRNSRGVGNHVRTRGVLHSVSSEETTERWPRFFFWWLTFGFSGSSKMTRKMSGPFTPPEMAIHYGIAMRTKTAHPPTFRMSSKIFEIPILARDETLERAKSQIEVEEMLHRSNQNLRSAWKSWT